MAFEREDGSKVHIKFLDYDDYSNNKVQVANQITVINKYETRFDVTLLINGLPLIQLELKKRGIALEDAFNQTERYRRHAYTGLFKYCDRVGIPRFSMHVLRHTFATRCIEGGMKPKTLQKILGHSNIGITMNLYVHITEDEKQREIDLVADALKVV